MITFALVCIGCALFRAGTIGQGLNFIHAMLVPQGLGIPAALDEVLTRQRLFGPSIALTVVALPAEALVDAISLGPSSKDQLLRYSAVAGIGPIACISALSSTFSPVLYFQF
ncbi:MAG: hypothetical protein AAB131_00225 [Actinomycetota bacterium]